MRFSCGVTIVAALLFLVSAPAAKAGADDENGGPKRSLSMLAPDRHSPPRPEEKIKPIDVRDMLFTKRPTDEAAARYEAMSRSIEEKVNYQTATEADLRAYYDANKDLARWYVRALVRSYVAALIQQTRQTFRRDRQYERERQRRDTARLGDSRGREPARAGATARGATAGAVTEESPPFIARFLSDATRVVERLTNDGLDWKLSGDVHGQLKLDIQSAILKSEVQSPVLNMGMSYRLRPPEQPMPFSGAEPSDAERLTLTGNRSIPGVGVHGAVSYDYLKQNLFCSLSRQIVGPLSGAVERSWNMRGVGVPMTSRASLSFSLAF